MSISRASVEHAISHVVNFGDTDVFPFPIENRVFKDKSAEIGDLLMSVDAKFDDSFSKDAPDHHRALAGVGYTGFRWAAQLDPLWNLYLLSLVIEIGDHIENARIPTTKEVVHSYRYKAPALDGRIFDPAFGWAGFKKKSLSAAKKHPHILICDISDFYSRVYHHRLENSLDQAVKGGPAGLKTVVKRIMLFLQHFSNNNSYGLPIGGNAARLLSEILLNRTDRLFLTDKLNFCRFADDYCVFADSEDEAFGALVNMSDKLLRNEGLSLQKAKTRILTNTDYLAENSFEDEEGLNDGEREVRKFMRLSLHFDPYSDTAAIDYENLKKELENFDIQTLITRELAKSRIHGSVARKLVEVVSHLAPEYREQAIRTFLENLHVLSPIFSTLMQLLKKHFAELPSALQDEILQRISGLVRGQSYITQIEVNLLFAIRLLGEKHSDENEELLNLLYKTTPSQLVRREIILMMAKWNATHWISDKKTQYASLGKWERRSFIVASYFLGDEGDHWRNKAKKGFTQFEKICSDWAGERFKAGTLGELL